MAKRGRQHRGGGTLEIADDKSAKRLRLAITVRRTPDRTPSENPTPLNSSIISEAIDSRDPSPLLPPVLPCDKGKCTLVLEMDGTLLAEFSDRSSRPLVDFVLRQKSTGSRTFVRKRPFLEEFLSLVKDLCEIVVFTNSSKQRADVILDRLQNRESIRHRLYRDSCTEIDGKLVKDLSRLGRDPGRVIIVDHCPFSYALQPSNAIPISWFNARGGDGRLKEIYNFIRKLSRRSDVRVALRQSNFRADSTPGGEKNPRNTGTDPLAAAPLLPPVRSHDRRKHTLVLDMDGTLLVELPQKLPNRLEDDASLYCVEKAFVYWRPGLKYFLGAMRKLFEIVVFTTSVEFRAAVLLRHFRRFIEHKLGRDSCTGIDGVLIKDLSRLGRDLGKVVIVDDSPHVFQAHRYNGIPIKSFDGDPKDRELAKLVPFLKELSQQEDVRLLIQSKYEHEVVAEDDGESASD